MSQIKVLLFAEDPGAANWLGPLAEHLASDGIAVRLLAEGSAVSYLSDRGYRVEDVTDIADLAGRFVDASSNAIVVGTAENFSTRAFELTASGRAKGIATFAVVDQPMNARHRFSGGSAEPLRHAPEIVFVADQVAANNLQEIGLQRGRIRQVGNPHHELVLKRGESLARGDRSARRHELFPDLGEQPLIVFLAELGYLVNPEARQWEQEFQLRGRGDSSYRTMVVLQELLDAIPALSPKPQVVVRLHPKSSRTEFSELNDEIAAFSAGGDPLAVCSVADLVVGMTTSLLEEAMLIGSRTLSILPRDIEAGWLPAIANGQIPWVSSREQLRASLPALMDGSAPRPAPQAVEGSSLLQMASEIVAAARAYPRRSKA